VVGSKYPAATNAQLLQSMVRNAKSHGGGPATFDPDKVWGYGEFDLPALLAADPTVYPDVNPFSGEPTVVATEAPAPAPEPDSASAAPEAPSEAQAPVVSAVPSVPDVPSAGAAADGDGPAAGGLGLVVGVLAGAGLLVVLVVVVVSRRRAGRSAA
jgi:hypothetical protein